MSDITIQPNGGPKIAAALAKAQLEFPTITKDAKNPHFSSKFASLDGMIAAVRPVLAANGIAVSQTATPLHEGKTLGITTTLYHESGEWISSSAFVPLAKMDPQGAGSALTYARRYSLAAALCIAAEDDDDGNAASRPAQRQQRQSRPAEQAPEQKQDDAQNAAKFPVTKWLGLAADRPMTFGKTKGKTLGSMNLDDLKELESWLGKRTDKAHFAPLLKDVKTVLADRALGTDDDSRMNRVHAAVAAEDSQLPFK